MPVIVSSSAHHGVCREPGAGPPVRQGAGAPTEGNCPLITRIMVYNGRGEIGLVLAVNFF